MEAALIRIPILQDTGYMHTGYTCGIHTCTQGTYTGCTQDTIWIVDTQTYIQGTHTQDTHTGYVHRILTQDTPTGYINSIHIEDVYMQGIQTGYSHRIHIQDAYTVYTNRIHRQDAHMTEDINTLYI